jgi:hypothetical protein
MKASQGYGAVDAWLRLGLDCAQTLAASAQVIARRTSRAPTPAQLLSMSSEKVEATLESAHAITRHMLVLPVADPAALWAAYARMMATGLRPYRTRAMRNARIRPRR